MTRTPMTTNEAHQRYIAQAQKCVEMLALLAMQIDTNQPNTHNALGATQLFQTGLEMLKAPISKELPQELVKI
ncbi:MAG: hypothetical protein F6K42_00535 [Leptolyngbya sp. SIO1D8]|nr:hypothetical protein [Leptolyngbya sp. SIO1D8]